MIFLWILLAWNIIVFGFYAVDKYKAVHHLWRIPEKVLLTEAVIGGGLGAILAGQICHHKTRKWYFWLAWIIGVTVDILLILVIINLM
ncbi:DUF1294 domain-containing protein [Lactococcus protaetiae]|uniref:DUF1294 domain-containing protein n=1 Tax=Lactococcus protaetiae TaxID=2592653 RepID=A0A514ZAQ5_9LACT|nr:DUF1294 domain-containing protein [Lactococcus protaetiae]QDK71661.1 DUF1294 domain-containing protein [Lactococcus protaetiae]